MNLAEVIDRWFGRVEIVLSGAEDDLRIGLEAMAAGNAVQARAAARRVLERAPGSPFGLALLADACEAAHLDAELALTLEELARRAPSRAEVWLRLGRARQTTGATAEEARSAFLRGLSVAEVGSGPRVEALLALADLDLAARDGGRAELWLSRIAGPRPDVVLRRAEARLLLGDPRGAKGLLEPLSPAPLDGRAALALGRARAEAEEGDPFGPLLRAFVLDEEGAAETLAGALSHLPSDPPTRIRIRSVVDAKGEESLTRWCAAFAIAEGNREAARQALKEAVRAAEPGAASALLALCVDDRDLEGLGDALRGLAGDADPLARDARAFTEAAAQQDRAGDALEGLACIAHRRLAPWAESLVRTLVASWFPAQAPAPWSDVVTRLERHAHALPHPEAAKALARLATDRSSPVLMAVVGEFNAGKSTFINALVGQSVAPTGILPTTAVPHRLKWSAGSLSVARIVLAREAALGERAEQIVAPQDLRAALAALDPKSVVSVEIRLPFPSLARVEVLDTPGFNAAVNEVSADHERLAWAALDEADIAVWLVDATQPVKQSERRVLEEASRRGLPVQILINKTDRLAEGDLTRVLETVAEGLAEMGVTSWRPPCALSSKLALAGRLGDGEALASSRWNAVQTLIDEEIVGKSDSLKERSLRRRGSHIVAMLREAYAVREAERDASARSRSAEAEHATRAAVLIDQGFDDLADDMARKLAEAARRWAADLSMVFVGRDPADHETAAADPKLGRYRNESALASLAPILLRETLLLAPADLHPALEASPLPAVLRAIVRTAAEALPLDVADAARLARVISRGSLTALVEQLVALAAARRAPSTAFDGVARELAAFAEALSPGLPLH